MSDPGSTTPNPGTPPPNQPPPGTPPVPPVPPTPPNPGTLPPPADDLSRLNNWAQSFAAREKEEGRQQVRREIAEKFGCTIEEAEAKLKRLEEAERANMTEAEQKLAEAQQLHQQAVAERAASHKVILDTLKTDALMDLGMTREQARASVDLVRVDGDITVQSVVAAANGVKTLFPHLFAGTGGNGTGNGTDGHQPPVDSATRGQPPGTPPPTTAKDRARSRLLERHPELARNKET